jgi:tetratricopeptide (TPR) repeat protein/TolB-like protein
MAFIVGIAARLRRATALFVMASVFLLCAAAHAQSAREQSPSGRLVLVLPFENRSHQPGLDWIADSFPAIFNLRLATAGFLPITREDRLYALDRLGLPTDLRPSRATAYRIAEEMDADYVIFGSYDASDGQLSAQAQVLDMRSVHMDAPLVERNPLTKMLDTENILTWRAIRVMDPGYSVPQAAFLAAVSQLRLDAFENYVRGVTATNSADRIRHLSAAVQLAPTDVPSLYQLGVAYFAAQEYEQAISQFVRVPSGHPLAMQAAFFLALAQFYTGHYASAGQSFSFIASRLPLPEVLNNEGVAISRQGKDGISLFQQAATADPRDEDYHFNLAVALRRKGDFTGAAREIRAALVLNPQDTEAKALQGLIAQNKPVVAADSETDTNEPVERLKRTFNVAEVRQASFALEQMEQMRLSSQPPAQRAATQAQDGDLYFNQGLLLEAEQFYTNALVADPQSAAAHAGLANVRLHTGDLTAARTEAESSLRLAPNAVGYVVLASVQINANQLQAAAASVSAALRLQPQNQAARQLKDALAARGVPLT